MAGVGVLELLLPVPADDADIELAIQDAETDDPVAPDRGVVPTLADRAWDAVAIQVRRNTLRPFFGDIFAEDAAHHLVLFLDDLAFAPDRLGVNGPLDEEMRGGWPQPLTKCGNMPA